MTLWIIRTVSSPQVKFMYCCHIPAAVESVARGNKPLNLTWTCVAVVRQSEWLVIINRLEEKESQREGN